MTSFLMILGALGLVVSIIIFIRGPGIDLNAVYSIAVTLWVTIVLAKWKER